MISVELNVVGDLTECAKVPVTLNDETRNSRLIVGQLIVSRVREKEEAVGVEVRILYHVVFRIVVDNHLAFLLFDTCDR